MDGIFLGLMFFFTTLAPIPHHGIPQSGTPQYGLHRGEPYCVDPDISYTNKGKDFEIRVCIWECPAENVVALFYRHWYHGWVVTTLDRPCTKCRVSFLNRCVDSYP